MGPRAIATQGLTAVVTAMQLAVHLGSAWVVLLISWVFSITFGKSAGQVMDHVLEIWRPLYASLQSVRYILCT